MYRDMTRGGITRSLLLFALPMMAGSLLQQLYNVADTLIVGRALGRDALAAVGSAFTLMTFLTSVFLGLAMGAGALFSIYLGRKDMASLHRAAALALCLTCGLPLPAGIPPMLLQWLILPLLALLTAAVQAGRLLAGLRAALAGKPDGRLFCLLAAIGALALAALGKGGSSTAAAALLLEAGVPCEIHEDILYRQWSKLMLNVGLNQVCAVYNVPYRGVQSPGTARDTMLAAMREAQALAAREGVTLTDADISAWMKMTDALNPDGMPSMRQDTLARRPTEVELFAGAMRRLGEKHSVPTPVNDMLYRRIAELEAAY